MPADPTDPDLPLPAASLGAAYVRYWQRFAVFTGRASRSEYWWVVLANNLIAIVLVTLVVALFVVGGAIHDSPAAILPNAVGAILALVVGLYRVATIIPSISVAVRRLHDADLSGLYYLLSLILFAGGIVLLVLTVLESKPAGRRFDSGAAAWQPRPLDAAPVLAAPIGAAAPLFPPAPAPAVYDATAPVPIAEPAPGAATAREEVRAVWAAMGAVAPVTPPPGSPPAWRRQGYLQVDRADGMRVLASDGLGDADGGTALGPGAELYLPVMGVAAAAPGQPAAPWRLALVAGAARRVGASGMHLPAELEQYGTLSMALPIDGVPDGWRGADGTLGVLIGVPVAGVPEVVATARGEVRLASLLPLRPEELSRIVVEGRTARAALAGRLAAMPLPLLLSPDRPAL